MVADGRYTLHLYTQFDVVQARNRCERRGRSNVTSLPSAMPGPRDATRDLQDQTSSRAAYMKQAGDRILTIHYPSVEFAAQWRISY